MTNRRTVHLAEAASVIVLHVLINHLFFLLFFFLAWDRERLDPMDPLAQLDPREPEESPVPMALLAPLAPL